MPSTIPKAVKNAAGGDALLSRNDVFNEVMRRGAQIVEESDSGLPGPDVKSLLVLAKGVLTGESFEWWQWLDVVDDLGKTGYIWKFPNNDAGSVLLLHYPQTSHEKKQTTKHIFYALYITAFTTHQQAHWTPIERQQYFPGHNLPGTTTWYGEYYPGAYVPPSTYTWMDTILVVEAWNYNPGQSIIIDFEYQFEWMWYQTTYVEKFVYLNIDQAGLAPRPFFRADNYYNGTVSAVGFKKKYTDIYLWTGLEYTVWTNGSGGWGSSSSPSGYYTAVWKWESTSITVQFHVPTASNELAVQGNWGTHTDTPSWATNMRYN